jgi:4-amino-4-deoxy-L-arabinose transferase-like glycosyltransferase
MESRTDRITVFLAAAVILCGCLYSISLGDQLRYLPDERDYDTLANSLALNGSYSLDGEHPTAYRAPGYPLFLAVFRLMGARVVHFRILNFILLGSALFILQAVLKRQSSPLSAALGVLFTAGYPVFFYTAGTLYPQILASFLFLLAIALFTHPDIQMSHYLLGGLLLGFLILTVPTFAFTLFVFLGWFLLNPRLRRPLGITLAVGGALLVVGLWTARNYAAFGSFVFVSSNSGENLLLGNSEHTLPNAGTNVDISSYYEQTLEMDEVERDAFYRAQALEYIREHPARAARLYGLKVLNYFNFRNELYTKSEGSSLRDLLVLFTYSPLLLVFFTRLAFLPHIQATRFEILLAVLYGLSALASAIFFTRIRFRLPFDALLIMLAAIFLAQLAKMELRDLRLEIN